MVVAAFVPLNEVLEVKWNITHLEVAAIPHLVGYIGRDVPRPTFGGVKADNANRILILPLDHPHDDGFEVRPL